MSRREKKPIDAGPGWLATYGDLVTLLLAFFVMMFAVSSVEQVKFKAFLSGLGHFDNTSAQPGVFPLSSDAEPQLVMNAGIGPGRPGGSTSGEGDGEAEAERERIEQRIEEAVQAAGLEGALEFRSDPRGIAAVIATDDVLFASGSAQLTPAGVELVKGLAAVLAAIPYDVTVEGHADTTPLNQGSYTNWNLSTDRAVTVVQRFAQQHGIGPERLTAVGHGEFKPLDPADTPEARARNRRVEIVILSGPLVSSAAPAAVAATVPEPAPPISLPQVDVVSGKGL